MSALIYENSDKLAKAIISNYILVYHNILEIDFGFWGQFFKNQIMQLTGKPRKNVALFNAALLIVFLYHSLNTFDGKATSTCIVQHCPTHSPLVTCGEWLCCQILQKLDISG